MLRELRLNSPKDDGPYSSLPMWIRPGTSDEGICRDIIEADAYKLAWAKSYLCPSMWRRSVAVIDIGANIGAFSRLALNLWPQARVFAYEPHPLNFGLLNWNLRHREATMRMAAVYGGKLPQSYLVERPGDEATEFGGWGLCQVLHDYRPDFENEVGVPCDIADVEEIEAIIQRMAGRHHVILKLDCEGCEFSILQSLSDYALRKVSILLGEFHCHALTMDYLQDRFHFGNISERLCSFFHCDELEERDLDPRGNGELFTFTALSRELTTRHSD